MNHMVLRSSRAIPTKPYHRPRARTKKSISTRAIVFYLAMAMTTLYLLNTPAFRAKIQEILNLSATREQKYIMIHRAVKENAAAELDQNIALLEAAKNPTAVAAAAFARAPAADHELVARVFPRIRAPTMYDRAPPTAKVYTEPHAAGPREIVPVAAAAAPPRGKRSSSVQNLLLGTAAAVEAYRSYARARTRKRTSGQRHAAPPRNLLSAETIRAERNKIDDALAQLDKMKKELKETKKEINLLLKKTDKMVVPTAQHGY